MAWMTDVSSSIRSFSASLMLPVKTKPGHLCATTAAVAETHRAAAMTAAARPTPEIRLTGFPCAASAWSLCMVCARIRLAVTNSFSPISTGMHGRSSIMSDILSFNEITPFFQHFLQLLPAPEELRLDICGSSPISSAIVETG